MTPRSIFFVLAVVVLVFGPVLADEFQDRTESIRERAKKTAQLRRWAEVNEEEIEEHEEELGERRHTQRERDREERDFDERERPRHLNQREMEMRVERRREADRNELQRPHPRHRVEDDSRGQHRKPNHPDRAMERVEHMHLAAQHLAKAGLEDISREVRRRAEEMERDLQHRHSPNDGHPAVLRELMEQVQQLRNEVRELRRAIQ